MPWHPTSLTETGNRRESKGRVNKASKLFASSFTKQFSKIAEKVPVYAELRDLIDMSVAAAWIQKQGLYEKAGWSMDLFGSEEKFPIEVGSPIERAETAVNIVSHSVYRGSLSPMVCLRMARMSANVSSGSN